MKEKYVTITGFHHYYGLAPFKVGRKIKCTKEPKNQFDSEAICVTMKHIGTVGYIANSPFTAATGTMSAGRLYEKVGKKFWVRVMFITGNHVIARVLTQEECEKTVEGEDTDGENITELSDTL